MRYVIEGKWTGHTRAQARIVYRIETDIEAIVEWIRKVRGIAYPDGTSLLLTVRPRKPRERVRKIGVYKTLLNELYWAGSDPPEGTW
jgi:hypothetical protein